MTLSLGVLLVAFVELSRYGDIKDCMFVIPGLMIPATVIGMLILSKKGVLEFGRYKVPLMCYAVLVGSFCAFGINLLLVSDMDRQVFFFGTGAMMFWFSDLSLSFRCFNKRVPDWFGTFVFTLYFLATYAVALSLRGF